MNNSYGFLGHVYDKLSEDIPYHFYANEIQKRIVNLKNRRILEIGGGSGLFTKYFLGAKEIHFLEPSKEMLEKAKKRLKGNLIYYNEIIENFQTDLKFDIILANLNVINYIIETRLLFETFEKVKIWLKEDGLFIFDINSPHKLRNILGNESYINEIDDIFYTWDNLHEEPFVYSALNFFVSEKDYYRRGQEELVERIYEVDEIIQILEMTGFHNIEYLDYDTFSEIKEETQRIVFFVKK